MNFKSLAIVAALLLTACYPATQLNGKNVSSVLDATASVNQLSAITVTGIQSHRALQSLEVFSPRNTETISCHDNQGTYLVSVSDVSSSFDVVFNDCAAEDGSQLDGIVNGSIESTDVGFIATLTGDVVATKSNQTAYLNPSNLVLNINEQSLNLTTKYDGTMYIMSDDFEGAVDVYTDTAFGLNSKSHQYSGAVSFRDSNQNKLLIELNNNGAHLALNGQHIRSFSHRQWTSATQSH